MASEAAVVVVLVIVEEDLEVEEASVIEAVDSNVVEEAPLVALIETFKSMRLPVNQILTV